MPQVNSFANDINDIPIPSELKWQRGDSMAITTESFRGGVLTYTGNALLRARGSAGPGRTPPHSDRSRHPTWFLGGLVYPRAPPGRPQPFASA